MQMLNTQIPGHSPTDDRAEHLQMPEMNQSTQGGDQTQAEQSHGEDGEAELNSGTGWRQGGPKPREQATNPVGDQAEQRTQWMSGGGPDAPSRFLSLTHVRQCHTKPWPVARYVDPTVSNSIVQCLITNSDKELVRAEHRCQAAQEPVPQDQAQDLAEQMMDDQANENLCQAEKIRDLSPKEENEKHENLENPELKKEGFTRQEDSRRLENPRGDEKEGKVNLKYSWNELRRIKNYLSENNENWKELEGKNLRRLEKEEKKLKSETMKIKSQRFGKAGNKKLTNLEELLITMNKRKLMEIEEVKMNLENRKAKKPKKENETPEGWKINSKRRLEMKLTCKEEKDLWTSLARHLGLIEKLEQWLKPCWLGSSSLEEQRGLISEEPPMHQLVGSRMKEEDFDTEESNEDGFIENESSSVETFSLQDRVGKYAAAVTIHEKYSQRPKALEEVCLAQFTTSYEIGKLPKGIQIEDNASTLKGSICLFQSDMHLPKYIILENDIEQSSVMRLRTLPLVLRIHKSAKKQGYEEAYSELLLFYPWRSERENLHLKQDSSTD